MVGVEIFVDVVWCVFLDVECYIGDVVVVFIFDVVFEVCGFFVVKVFLDC